MAYALPMPGISWKEEVRKAMSALPKSVSTTDIAEELGIDRNRLYNFLSRGSLNPDELKKLDEWLILNGYKKPTTDATRYLHEFTRQCGLGILPKAPGPEKKQKKIEKSPKTP